MAILTPSAAARNAIVMATLLAATAFGLGWLLLILATLFWNGFAG